MNDKIENSLPRFKFLKNSTGTRVFLNGMELFGLLGAEVSYKQDECADTLGAGEVIITFGLTERIDIEIERKTNCTEIANSSKQAKG